MKIKILKNGPYEVTGGVPLSRKEIAPGPDGILTLHKLKVYAPLDPQKYHLCRCGKSKRMPFCDGSHAERGSFNGAEVADRAKYLERAKIEYGPTLDLLDDNRCAFARFCHRQNGEVWTLTKKSDDPENRRQAIEGINECPTGRLVARDKDGKVISKKFMPEIEIIDDPRKKCSAGIFVKGNIPIESSDGTAYEIRDRVALCRCGQSKNMPFCDATHVSIEFDDNER